MDPREVLSRPAGGPDLVVRYGEHRDAVIDVFVPRGGGDEDPPAGLMGPSPEPPVDSRGEGSAPFPVRRAPLIVFLHGGFWRKEWDRTHAVPLARGLVAAGFAVATPEYRRGPGSWPDMSADVVASLEAVRSLVDQSSPGHIDPTAPLTLMGHSAGGHLALWAALRAGPDLVRRVIALAPVTDPRFAARTGMGDGAAQELLGGEPDEVPEAYDSADVVGLLPGSVPVTVIQGDADLQVPVEMNRRIADEVGSSTGSAFRYVELPGTDHFALIDPASEAWPAVLRACRSADV